MRLAGDLLCSASELCYGVCHSINFLILRILSLTSPGTNQALVLPQISFTWWVWGAGEEGTSHRSGPGQRGAPAGLPGSPVLLLAWGWGSSWSIKSFGDTSACCRVSVCASSHAATHSWDYSGCSQTHQNRHRLPRGRQLHHLLKHYSLFFFFSPPFYSFPTCNN